MTEPAQITIDNAMPGDTALLVQGPASVILQHGGIMTRMQYSSVESMGLDTFKHKVLPKLKCDQAERDLYCIRDTLDGVVTLILGDQVLKYNLTNIEECGVKNIVKLVREEARVEEAVVTAPDLPWSLVAKVQTRTHRNITVRLPETYRRFYMPKCDVDIHIWYPPLWACVTMPASGRTAHMMYLAIEKAFNMDWRKTELLQLPLPNVFESDGSICYGNVSLATALTGQTTDAQIIMSMMTMFFDSEFNDHLLEYYRFNEIVGNAYNELPEDKEMEQLVNRHYACADFLKELRVLKEKNGWRKLKFEPHHKSPVDFAQSNY